MERDRKTEIERKGTEIKRWERDREDVDCRGRVETVTAIPASSYMADDWKTLRQIYLQ